MEQNRLKENAEDSSFEAICSYVEKNVIFDKRPELLTSIYVRYVSYCEDSNETPYSSAQYFMQKLEQKFQHNIKIQSPLGKKSGVMVYSSSISDNAVRVAYDYTTSDECPLTKAALLLRTLVKSIKKVNADNVNFDSLVNGEASPPELLDLFFKILYGGPNVDKHTSKVKRVASSSSQDVFLSYPWRQNKAC